MSIAASSDPINPDPTTQHIAPFAASHVDGATSDSPVARAAQFAQLCAKPRQTQGGWQVCCPAHEDTNPSLSITTTADRVLLKCHAGCAVSAIVKAVGWTMRDLFTTHPIPHRRILKVYDYHNAEGLVVHQTVRYSDKTFRQRQPHPSRPGEYLWKLNGVEPVLYHLPQVLKAIQAGEPIYIVEGEKDAETLSDHGLTATCNPMGAGKWRETYSAALTGGHCIMLPDHDKAGGQHAEQVATSLQGIAASVTIVPAIHTEAVGSDVSDWLAAGHTLDELHKVVEATAGRINSQLIRSGANIGDPHETSAKPISSLNSLNSHLEWPTIDDKAFYGVAGTLVNTLKDHTEADPIALLIQALTYFGVVLSRRAFYRVEATRHYTNLATCLVGATGKGRKGTAYDHIDFYMHAADTSWGMHNVTGGCGSGEGLIYAVRDPAFQQQPIREKGKGRVTGYERVMTDQGVIDKRLLVYDSEFAGVLKVAGRDGNLLSVILRQAWDSGNLRNTVKGSPLCATNAHISIIGHITIDELQRYLTTTEIGNGFANRFLFPLVKRSKPLPEGGHLETENVHELTNQLKEAFTAAREIEEMHRDSEATAIWKAVYEPLSEGKPGLVGSLLARGEAQVLRLSMLYALLDGKGIIDKQHLNAALAVWQYCEDSAFYIFGTASGDATTDTLLTALKKAYPQGLDRTTIFTDIFHGHLRGEELDRVVRTLETQKCITVEPLKSASGKGRHGQKITYLPCELSEESELKQGIYLSLSNDAMKSMSLNSHDSRINGELNTHDPASDAELASDISALDALIDEEVDDDKA